MKTTIRFLFTLLSFVVFASPTLAQSTRKPGLVQARRAQGALQLASIPNVKPRNVIFILTDDHRYDALGFLKAQSFIETPHLDALARNGVYLKNAFVTTALCSPSRASILTGLYAHQHRVVDNNNP
ncbi:MAG TPA: sulfatase-like hydrolase/transferase, partial [Blastocatellia bacterium]